MSVFKIKKATHETEIIERVLLVINLLLYMPIFQVRRGKVSKESFLTCPVGQTAIFSLNLIA